VQDVLGLPLLDLTRAIREVAPEPYRAAQIQRWIWDRRAASFGEMTDLPRAMREALADRFEIGLPRVAGRSPSVDGAEKFLLELADGVRVEAGARVVGEIVLRRGRATAGLGGVQGGQHRLAVGD